MKDEDKMKKGGLYDGAGSEWNEDQHPRDDDGKFVAVSEFRFLDSKVDIKNHPAHLYAQKDDDVKYLQLTHSRKIRGKDKENIPLMQNPNPKDKRQSFFVPQSKNGKLKDFRKDKKNWELSEEDNEKMKPYRDDPFNK